MDKVDGESKLDLDLLGDGPAHGNCTQQKLFQGWGFM